MDAYKNVENSGENKRRSSRLSGGYGKRKRESNGEELLQNKMTKTGEEGAATVNFTMDDIKRFMNGEFLDSINQNMDKRMEKLSDRIDETQNELRTHRDQVDKELEKMRLDLQADRCLPAAVVAGKPQTYASAALTAAKDQGRRDIPSLNDHNAKLYWRARKSSRLFPVAGETEEEIRRNLRHFYLTKLRVPAADIQDGQTGVDDSVL